MNQVETHFLSFIETQKLRDKNILLLVSGGVDSMVLAKLAVNFLAAKNIGILHINHNTRPENQADWDLVEKFCQQNNVAFFGEKIETQPEKNKEKFWRSERKKIAKAVAAEFNAKKILTAHHATDLVETMIFRLTKGTGLNGLSPFDISTKPLWNVAKSDLIAYAQSKKIIWNEDNSNLENNFDRNKIRNLVLPTLRTITPNLEKVFITQSENFSEYQDFIQTKVSSDTEISLKKFLDWHVVLQKEWIKKQAEQNFSAKELNEILHWLTHDPAGGTKKILQTKIFQLEKGTLKFINK